MAPKSKKKKDKKEPDRLLIVGKPDYERCDNKVVSARYSPLTFLPVVRINHLWKDRFLFSFFAYQFVPERVLNGNTVTDIDNSNCFTFTGRRYANNSDGSRMCIFYLWVD